MDCLFQILSAAVVLLLVMDPAGNLPIFTALLKGESANGARKIILRESFFALVILLVFLLFGDWLLKILQVSQPSLKIAGGVILFLIALKMIFGSPVIDNENRDGKMIFVPMAIPLIAGPSAITTVILMHGSAPLWFSGSILLLAWSASTMILILGRSMAEKFGKSVMNALESLMGFTLAVVAVEMLVSGIRIIMN